MSIAKTPANNFIVGTKTPGDRETEMMNMDRKSRRCWYLGLAAVTILTVYLISK